LLGVREGIPHYTLCYIDNDFELCLIEIKNTVLKKVVVVYFLYIFEQRFSGKYL